MAFIEIIFPALNRRSFINEDRSLVLSFELRQTIVNDLLLGCLASSVDLLLTDERRVAVEVGVCEPLRRRTGVIDDVEPKLAVVVAHPCSAPDDLFKLRQRADDTGDHDVLTSRGIDTGRKQL